MHAQSDRRRHARFSLPPMYTRVEVRSPDGASTPLEGHAYDISEGGVRFELDHEIDPASLVEITIELPQPILAGDDAGRVTAVGPVVWRSDDDAETGGPVRMAVSFDRFADEPSREALRRRLRDGRYAAAA